MMSARALSGAALTVLLSVSACGGDREPTGAPSPSASVTASKAATTTPTVAPTVAPRSTPASKALAELQASLPGLTGLQVTGGTTGTDGVGKRSGITNLETGDFRSTIAIGRGATLTMLRQADLVWTKAPSWYWVRVGYTQESAAKTRGKWVVATATSSAALVGSMDPGILLKSVGELKPEDAISVANVAQGRLQGSRVLTFRQGKAVQRIYLTRGTSPKPLRITTTTGKSMTWIDITIPSRTFAVTLPSADDVLQP